MILANLSKNDIRSPMDQPQTRDVAILEGDIGRFVP